ncbi:MAG: DNA translocase FtsK 4TM domain-containing protein [Candidatus Saccharimonadales bacterium]
MAKRTTRNKKKPSHNKKKEEKQASLAPGVGREIAAVAVLALGILLLIAIFFTGGRLTDGIISGLSWLFGSVVFLLPIVLVYLSIRLFIAKTKQLSPVHYVGLILLVLALSGLFSIFTGADTFTEAREGMGGGVVGYILGTGMANLLSTPGAVIILIATVTIAGLLASNITISEVVQFIKNFRETKQADDNFSTQLSSVDDKQIKMKINAKVPLAKSNGKDSAKDEFTEPEVLIASNDPDWKLPTADLLEDKQGQASAGNPKEKGKIIEETLASFGIQVSMDEVNIGPTVTQYTLKPASGVRLSKITELEHNLALNLAAQSLRVEAPIPGKSAVGIEVPNEKSAIVRMREILKSADWQRVKSPLSFILGKGVAGNVEVADLSRMPHLLVAGATGSGKSVMINSFLLSLLYRNSPADLKLILVDPKQVELSLYKDIPHLLSPVITSPEKTISALKWAVAEMDRRYDAFAELGKRNITEYNSSQSDEHMPNIVIVIDEMADLMMLAASDVESLIVRLAQKSRATGIHLVLATQRPSVNVITGLIKANVPARLSFSTVSQIDSRTIIDQAGAEKLLGNGDMLFSAPEFTKPRRIQGVFVNEKEVRQVTDFLREAREPQYNDEVLNQQVKISGGANALGDMGDMDDDLFNEAAKLVVESGKASASLIQRRLRVGYSRAARLMDLLEERGIVSGPDGSRPRDVLVRDISEIEGDM